MAVPRPIWTPRLTVPVALTLALFLAACAGGTGSSSTPAASEKPSGASTEPASASTAPTAQATIAPDADLATLLPTTVAGTEWTVNSYSGDPPLITMGAGISGSVGVAPTDVEYAVAAAPNADSRLGHVIYAIRFSGADSAAIEQGIPKALGGIFLQSGQIGVTEETIGGKQVSVLPSNPEAQTTYYYYVIGEVAFIVQTPDRAEAEDALAQLP